MADQKRIERVYHPPGSMVYRGRKREEPAMVRVIRYNAEEFHESVPDGDDGSLTASGQWVTWIHVNGIHDVDLIGRLGSLYRMHPLLLEDVLSTETPPKLEEFDHAVFASLNVMKFDATVLEITASNVSLVLMNDLLISFQESGPDFTRMVYERLKGNKGLARSRSEDYLFYRLLDVIVNDYKTILDHIESHTEELEESAVERSGEDSISRIHLMRRKLNRMRRNVHPLSAMIGRIYHEPATYFKEETMHFIRDLLDDLEHVQQRIENTRENLLSIIDINYTNISMKTNEVMRVLTIVATLFIPLTFLAGIYGMNFQYMPELSWRYGYVMFWGILTVMVLMMLFYFKRQKWI